MEVHLLPALEDNYIFVVRDEITAMTAVIDPSEAQPVLAFLQSRGWKLNYIFNTHHHHDHTGGNEEIRTKTGAELWAAKYDEERIPDINVKLVEGDKFQLGKSPFHIWHIPSHTTGHIAFWFPKDKKLFCGDTLFAMGCGRLFEGKPEQMFDNFSRFMELPAETEIYCAHEYSQKNARFALQFEPGNVDLVKRSQQIEELRGKGLPTIPTTVKLEMATNPFMRCHSAEIRKNLNMVDASDLMVFVELRRRRNIF